MGTPTSDISIYVKGIWFLSVIQDSPDQCLMPINADRNSGIDPNVDQFQSIPINAGTSRIDPALISNDRH